MALTTQDLLNSYARELILLAGKDGTGKSCSVVSTASLVEVLNADATFHVIDTENKFASAVRSFGPDAPTNLSYYRAANMNEAIDELGHVLSSVKPGDWLAVESIGRLWDMAQDLAYRAVAGVTKAQFLKLNKGEKTATGAERSKSPIPSPDDFWKIAKGAYDGDFMYPIIDRSDLNVILTTTIAKPPKADAFIKENVDRKAARIELGIDFGLDGAPRLPYQPETLAVLQLAGGKVSSRILRDNNSKNVDTRPEFDVPDRMSWAQAFWENCRNA
jgi:hypothetical protein